MRRHGADATGGSRGIRAGQVRLTRRNRLCHTLFSTITTHL